MQQLSHTLKILSETEKQLRTSKNQTTWLTVALLQLNSVSSSSLNANETRLCARTLHTRALFLAKWGFKMVKEHWNLYGIGLQKYVNPIHSETSFEKRESWLLFALTKLVSGFNKCGFHRGLWCSSSQEQTFIEKEYLI